MSIGANQQVITNRVTMEQGEKPMEGRLSQLWSRHQEGVSTLISGTLILTAWLGSAHLAGWDWLIYLTAFVIGGYSKAYEGLRDLFLERKLDVNLLMLAAGAGAAVIGYWMEGALLIFIFALSGALESYSEQRSQRDLSALMSIQPQWALLVEGDEERQVAIDALQIGDRVLVKPGEQIPADGVVIQGASEVNQAAITGESVPVEKEKQDEVFAGTLNGQGSLIVEVTCSAEKSTFSKILRLVQEAQNQEPASQQKIQRFEEGYAKVIIAATGVLIVLPPLLFDWSWGDAFYRAMVFLVVASPCAVVASIMPAVLSAMSNGARKGLLFKGGAYVQSLSDVKVVAFDKTGTLTMGELEVTDIFPLGHSSKEEILQAAASLESMSEHPIAQAVVKEAKRRALKWTRPESFQSKTGFGVEADWKGERWRVGKPSWQENLNTDALQKQKQLESEGKTVILVSDSQGTAGLIALQDRIRPEAKAVISRLKKRGIQVVMLTGDRRTTADTIAQEAGIDRVEAELLPEEKVKAVQQLEQEYGPTAMVGDGVNDAPALATASVGIAMGAAGSDVALDTARVVLMNDDLHKVADAITLGQRTWRVVKQNLVFALCVIALLIFFNFMGEVPLPLGVIGHEGSTLLVILNGLRLLR